MGEVKEKRDMRQVMYHVTCAARDVIHQSKVTHYSVTPRHEAPQQLCCFITWNFSRSVESKKYALQQQKKGKGEGNLYASLPFPSHIPLVKVLSTGAFFPGGPGCIAWPLAATEGARPHSTGRSISPMTRSEGASWCRWQWRNQRRHRNL